MPSHVNLDALVPREDFDTTDPFRATGTRKTTLAINDLKIGEFLFSALRKLDFQRETSEWDPKKVVAFIESFLNAELIPAVILWQSASSFTFVIDGSHRLSSIAAWINDDYGDGTISKEFYEGNIPDEQREIANKTRVLIDRGVGSYEDFKSWGDHPAKADPNKLQIARRLGTLAVQVQWVEGNSESAEASFFKINQNASKINPAELRVLERRRTPIGITARAIVRSGKGHKYWSSFGLDVQNELEVFAQQLNALLFQPQLPHSPIKTLDLPMAGEAYAAQSLPLVLDFIELVNEGKIPDIEEKDPDGAKTLACIKRCKEVAERISSNDPSSLGLHPIVYFYSANGRYKIASFLAISALMLEFEAKSSFDQFTKVRKDFESLLIQADYLIQQIVRQRRSAQASFPIIKDFYLACIELLHSGKDISNTLDTLVASGRFGRLTQETVTLTTAAKPFSRDTKARAFIREALQGAPRCEICEGYLHRNAISIDHKVPKRDGGLGTLANAQLAHPYCNTGYKA